MKDKTIISTTTLLTSLLAYWYAKTAEKDTGPLVMLGGFVGSIIGENIVEHLQKKDKV
jgi:uncharacterized membrane protein YfcA